MEFRHTWELAGSASAYLVLSPLQGRPPIVDTWGHPTVTCKDAAAQINMLTDTEQAVPLQAFVLCREAQPTQITSVIKDRLALWMAVCDIPMRTWTTTFALFSVRSWICFMCLLCCGERRAYTVG
jgi:hypothetical protein